MSRTHRQEKCPSTDFWSRRSFGKPCIGYGKTAKNLTKSKERMRDKAMIRRATNDNEDFDNRFGGE